MHYLPQLNWNGWGRQSGKNPRAAGGAAAAANLLPVCDWMPCFYSDSPDLHHRCNKWEHILGILVQIECLWGVFFGGLPLAPKGELIACALVILFFPIHSVIRDPFFFCISWEERFGPVLIPFVLFPPFHSSIPMSILLWPWWEGIAGSKEREARKLYVMKTALCGNNAAGGRCWHML